MHLSALVLSALALGAAATPIGVAPGPFAQSVINMAGITGRVEFYKPQKCGTTTTHIKYQFDGLAAGDSAPYKYHIHVSPVGENNNCTATGGHYDPHSAATTYAPYTCTPGVTPQDHCEVGDLSGKHGSLAPTAEAPQVSGQYDDDYVKFTPDNTVIGRSIVIHNSKGDRIACANIDAVMVMF
ncbi:hypothetical protein H4R35_001516 [Dimargaris xerosporica]|nr:hypothetical protein H4R35_001516 [Dimargaris xerosporica]